MARSFTVGPRIEFDLDGYVRIRVWDPEVGEDRYVYLHRLAAFAAAQIDALDDSHHVHQRNRDRWDNRPENLEASPPKQIR